MRPNIFTKIKIIQFLVASDIIRCGNKSKPNFQSILKGATEFTKILMLRHCGCVVCECVCS